MSKHVYRSILLASAALLMAACATQPGSLDDKYFEREANNYLKFQHEGKTVYCQNTQAASLIPYKMCITEAGLRQLVENTRRNRNPVTRPVLATTGSIG
jgi:starvation-inducible outer membrane lipoprotein